MKSSKIYTLFGFIALLAIIIYSISGMKFSGNYAEKMQKERADKNDFFKNDKESPLTKEQKKNFHGLNYFPISEKYKVKAKFRINPSQEKITLQTSDGTTRTYTKYGYAEFLIDNIPQRLAILKSTSEEDGEGLFLPFYDKTSAETTYGGGRFLDLENESDDFIVIDFNEAYNPYCAYNHNFSCPIPPRENKITVEILAGEKNYK